MVGASKVLDLCQHYAGYLELARIYETVAEGAEDGSGKTPGED